MNCGPGCVKQHAAYGRGSLAGGRWDACTSCKLLRYCCNLCCSACAAEGPGVTVCTTPFPARCCLLRGPLGVCCKAAVCCGCLVACAGAEGTAGLTRLPSRTVCSAGFALGTAAGGSKGCCRLAARLALPAGAASGCGRLEARLVLPTARVVARFALNALAGASLLLRDGLSAAAKQEGLDLVPALC